MKKAWLRSREDAALFYNVLLDLLGIDPYGKPALVGRFETHWRNRKLRKKTTRTLIEIHLPHLFGVAPDVIRNLLAQFYAGPLPVVRMEVAAAHRLLLDRIGVKK